ncbi:MAG TPA: protease modulator HflC [Candidatus Binatia bacterium]|jgi:membrane protease subunit HflC|nr:protease modulator HflC [Candidatus Binatia bacterium]
MDRRWIVVIALVGGFLAVWNLALFTVPQWMQAMVVQLGEPVRIVQEPGLYWKIPFIQNVVYFDRRLLDQDTQPKEILTRDKQQLVVDNYTRWRIIDPLQFVRTVRDENGAQSRLDDIVYSNLRETLGRHTLREIVSEKRQELLDQVTKRSDEKAREYGIEVVDVRVKRVDLPEKNELNVFNRMRTERERLAKKFRAEGDEEARKIRSGSDKEVQILMADARQKSEVIRGEGDAQAVAIFADAYGRDAEFYQFVRTLEAYRNTLGEGTTAILSPDSDFFRLLKRVTPGTESPPK